MSTDFTVGPAPGSEPASTLSSLSQPTPLMPWLASGAEDSEEPGTPREPSPPILLGALLDQGRYKILGRLGYGGMGEVYRAWDYDLDQQVALKFLAPHLLSVPRRRERFRREVSLARKVSHRNVCRVYDVGEAEGHLFLSMEWIDGDDLATLLRGGRSAPGRKPSAVPALPMARALDLGWELCHGLAAAHEQGVLHRDLKPSNLMVDRGGHLHITDFGLASVSAAPTLLEVQSGTPPYMAPEQLAGEAVSERSDLYALGRVLYELVTGRPAFADEAGRPLRHPAGSRPVAPSHLVPAVDARVERIILRCLEADPLDRPSSALAVAMVLAQAGDGADARATKTILLTSLASEAAGGSPPPQLPEALVRSWRRRVTTLVEENLGHLAQTSCPGIGPPETQAIFDSSTQAVCCALAIQQSWAELRAGTEIPIASRIALHLDEVFRPHPSDRTPASMLAPEGIPRLVSERLLGLAMPSQILMTRGAFDLARKTRVPGRQDVRWLAHGSYEVDGLDHSLEIFEVGDPDPAPLCPPPDSPTARRRLIQETVSGWRPAPGLAPPQRPDWILERKLSEGGFGEVWLAIHQRSAEKRAFKFCFDSERLKALQREITLFRLITETLGDRDDIARIFSWNFDSAPYYIESEYTAEGSLVEWARGQGGIERIPRQLRLEILAQVATALAAAHSVGVLHKDVKPSNVLIMARPDGTLQARLSDFGVGRVTEKNRLLEAGITDPGFTEPLGSARRSRLTSGTRLYMAPEILEGRPASLQADIYALGVMLYQTVVGDLSRALAPGWERAIDDPLLVEDIAAAVDGSAERRLGNARRLAERLRTLEQRRAQRSTELREREEARRNRLAVERSRRRRKIAAIAATILFCFVGILGVQARQLSVQARELTLQAHRLKAEAEKQTRLASTMIGIILDADPFHNQPRRMPEEGVAPQGEIITARDLLIAASSRVETQLEGQPEVQVPIFHALGKVLMNLGLYTESRDVLEKARALADPLYGVDDPVLADILTTLADVLNNSGESKAAMPHAKRALAIREQRFGNGDPRVAASLKVLANTHYFQEDFETSEVLLRRALRIQRESYPEESQEVATAMIDLTTPLMARGQYDEAERLMHDSLAIRRRALGEHHPHIPYHLHSYAALLRQRDRPEEALLLYREAIVLYEEVLGDEHPYLATCYMELSMTLQQLGKPEDSLLPIRRALEMQIELAGNDHFYVALTRIPLAQALVELERGPQAEQEILEALPVLRRKYPDGSWRIQQAEAILAASRIGRYPVEELEAELLIAERKLARSQGNDSRAARLARHYLDRLDAARVPMGTRQARR